MSSPPENEELNQVMTKGEVIAPLQLDPDEYREDLAEFGLSKQQENELLQTLWNIMSIMVDIGWGVDTVQMFLPGLFEKDSQDSGKLIQQKSTQKAFSQSAKSSAEKENYDE